MKVAVGAAALVLASGASTARPSRPLLTYSPGTPKDARGLCLVAAAGGQATRLTGAEHRDYDAAWARDGKRFTFTRDVNRFATNGGSDNVSDVFVADADGRRARNLTHGAAVFDEEPSWSPDGRRIVWVGAWHGSTLETMNADGGGKLVLARSSGLFDGPSFSPDGKRILYALSPGGDGHGGGVFTRRADGRGTQHLLVANAGNPASSPDGRRLAFVRRVDAYLQVFVANADGSDPVQITTGDGDARRPRWSPGGKLIAYMRHVGPVTTPDQAIYVVGADGTNDHVVSATGYDPTWRPAGAPPTARLGAC